MKKDKNYLVQFPRGKNLCFCSTLHIYEKYPTLYNVEQSYCKETTNNSMYNKEKLSKTSTVDYKSLVEYEQTAQTLIHLPRAKIYHGKMTLTLGYAKIIKIILHIVYLTTTVIFEFAYSTTHFKE